MAASPKPKQSQPPEPNPPSATPAEVVSKQQTTPQPRRTLFDTVATALAGGELRQRHAKPLTPAETDAKARHGAVTYQIGQLFTRSDARDKLAAVPVTERYRVFRNELCRLHDELEKVLSLAIVAYAKLATTHRSELPDDLLGWVKAHVDADRSGVRGYWWRWICVVASLNTELGVSLNSDLDFPAWINYPVLHFALGRLPSDIELAAALPAADAEFALKALWMQFSRDLSKAVDLALLDAKEKLATVPTSNPSAPTQDEDTGQPVQSREKLARKIHDPNTATVRNQEAADWYDVSRKTICEWKANGKLQGGQKRSTVTCASILALDAKSGRHRVKRQK